MKKESKIVPVEETGKKLKEVFDSMRQREVNRLNQSYIDYKNILIEVRDRLHSENRVTTLKDLEDLRREIVEYIELLENLELTAPETVQYIENKHLIERNKEFKIQAIENLRSSKNVVEDRIRKRINDPDSGTELTLKAIISEEKLLKLRPLLVDKYCNPISKNDFLYLFTGKPVTNSMKRIEWKKSKVEAKRLLISIVGEKFSNQIVNKCFIWLKNPRSKMDSNVKLTTGYPNIDNILKEIE